MSGKTLKYLFINCVFTPCWQFQEWNELVNQVILYGIQQTKYSIMIEVRYRYN